MAHRSQLFLGQRTSVIAATAVVLSMNLCHSQTMVETLKLEVLKSITKVKGSGVFGLWTKEIESATRVKKEELTSLYSTLVQSLDSDMLKGLLSKDKDIWL